MTVLVIFLVETALLLLVIGYVAVQRVRNDRLAVRRRVVVNTIDGNALQGILWARRGRLLVLRDALLLERGVDPVPIDGEAMVDRDQVAWVQNMQPGGAV